jgi:hypothetical protein
MMTKTTWFLTMLAIAAVAAACTSVPAQPTVVPPAPTMTAEPPTTTPEIFMPVPEEARAEVAAREALARQLGLDMAQIALRKIVPTDWPDSCLGLATTGQACQIAVTPGYRVVLEAGDAVYEVRTDSSAQTVLIAGRVDATLGELPAVCQGIGLATFYSPENGFCFAYPASFTLGETSPVRSEVYGPPLDDNAEALRAALLLEIQPGAGGQDLQAVVDNYLVQFEGMAVPEIARTPMTLGGEPAERLEVVPGREGSRDVFMLHGSTLFHLMFSPSVRDFPQAADAVDNLFLTVTSSFTFLPAAGN